MMLTCLGLDVRDTDQLPQTICSDCGRLLASFHKFRLTANTSYAFLRDILQKQADASSSSVRRINEIFLPEPPVAPPSSSSSSSAASSDESDEWEAPPDANESAGNLSLEKIAEEITRKPGAARREQRIEVAVAELRSQWKEKKKSKDKEQCPDCGLFVRFLNQHMVTHSSAKPFECEICKMSFTRLSSVKKHVRFVHMDIRNVQCPQCEKAFHNRTSLKSHMRTHTVAAAGSPVQRHTCTICNSSFTTEKALQRHQSNHFNGTLHECGTCEKQFFTKWVYGNIINFFLLIVSRFQGTIAETWARSYEWLSL